MGYAALKKQGLRAQVTLETVIMWLMTFLFIFGVVRLWVWSNAQIAYRQPAYEGTRVTAGSSSPGENWNYTPKELTDDWVFNGIIN